MDEENKDFLLAEISNEIENITDILKIFKLEIRQRANAHFLWCFGIFIIYNFINGENK